jgi:O-succinylbenzoate synthase
VITVNGLAGGPSPEDVARAVGAVVEAGYRTVKVKLGFEDDVERIQSVSTAAPDGVRIRLDANAMWTIPQASELCACAHDLLGHRLEYVEDPVSSASELEELRAVTSVPIAADELIRSRADLDTLLAKRLVDVVVAKPPLLGGISKVRLMADAASSADVDVVISSMFDGPVGLEAWCHLAAGINGDRAHGLGTAQFLAADAARVLVPREGMIHLS